MAVKSMEDIKKLIDNPFQKIEEKEFNSLALKIFDYQYNNNKVYQKYCRYKKIYPDKIKNWKQIPFMPIDIFKYAYVACFPINDTVQVFSTSGTSFGVAGRHYFTKETLELKNKCFFSLAKGLLMPGINKARIIVLCVPAELRNSKFLHNAQLLIKKYGTKDSDYFINEKGKFEINNLIKYLQKHHKQNTPLFILLNSDLILDFISICNKKRLKFPLPKRSRIMLSGFKETKVAKQEFFLQLQMMFDLPEYSIIDDYGMTESTSSWYDNVLRNKLLGNKEQRCKEDPCWAKTIIVDPVSLKEVEYGKVGLIRFVNLANSNTLSFIQTNDLGFKVGKGFEVIGKAAKEEAPGYYLLLNDSLS